MADDCDDYCDGDCCRPADRRPAVDPAAHCDDCDVAGARDYGYAILCDDCDAAGDPGPSDYACRRAERRGMGIDY